MPSMNIAFYVSKNNIAKYYQVEGIIKQKVRDLIKSELHSD